MLRHVAFGLYEDAFKEVKSAARHVLRSWTGKAAHPCHQTSHSSTKSLVATATPVNVSEATLRIGRRRR